MKAKELLRSALIALAATICTIGLAAAMMPANEARAYNTDDSYDFIQNGYVYRYVNPDKPDEGVILMGYRNNAYTSSTLNVPSQITYSFTEYKVKGIYEGAFRDNEYITLAFIGTGVETIGPNAFNNCKNLETINVPYTVKEIGENAFRDCTALKTVDLTECRIDSGSAVLINEKSDYTGVFCGCTSLASVSLPTYMNFNILPGDWFKDCTSLTEISIPENVVEIDVSCFENDTALTTVNITGDGLYAIDKAAFMGCTALKSVSLNENFKCIADKAFMNCTSLTDVTLDSESSFDLLGVSAFENSGITKFTMPIDSTISTIGSSAFKDCSSLSEVIFADSIVYINSNAFQNCTSLKGALIVPENVTEIDLSAFENSGISSIVFPSLKPAISDYAFASCPNLHMIILNDHYDINEKVFYDCDSIYEVEMIDRAANSNARINDYYGCASAIEIPTTLSGLNLTTISTGAFTDRSKLTSVAIPKTITSIDSRAFVDCVNADITYYYGTSVKEDSFVNCKSVTVLGLPTPTATATPTSAATPTPTAAPTATATPTAVATPTSGATATPTPASTVTPTVEPTTTDTPTPTPTTAPIDNKADIRAFVDRLYNYVLNRVSEDAGAQYWTDELYNFTRTGGEVAQGFIFSDEFINRNTTDREFLEILYRTFFNREPDEDGMNFWLSQLSSGAMDRVAVANGFIYSQEWADTCAAYGIRSGGDIKPSVTIKPTELTYAFVERLYTNALNRNYDELGREYWAGELANFNLTGEQAGAMFFLSDEMINYNLSDREYISRLYKTFMNRDADEDGAAYWLGVLQSGADRSQVVFGFTRSEEFTAYCVEARILPFV